MKLAVIGSRGFSDKPLIFSILNQYYYEDHDLTIISGGAKGADSLAEEWAKNNNIPIKIFPAEWDKHGKSAGYIRNATIWDNADEGLAFWDGKSKGTEHSFAIAKKQKKQLVIVRYNDDDVEIIDTLENVK